MKLSKFLERLNLVITNSKDDIELSNEQMNEVIRLLNLTEESFIKLINNSKNILLDELFNYIELLQNSNSDLTKINCDLIDSNKKLAIGLSNLIQSTKKLLK